MAPPFLTSSARAGALQGAVEGGESPARWWGASRRRVGGGRRRGARCRRGEGRARRRGGPGGRSRMARAPERSRTAARGRFPAGPGARSHPESTSTKMSARARVEEGRATDAGEGRGAASAEEGHRRWRHNDAAVRGEGQ